MRLMILIVSMVGCVVSSATSEAKAFILENRIYFQLPNNPTHWVSVDDLTKQCTVMKQIEGSKGVYHLRSIKDETQEVMFSDWNVLYQRNGTQDWQAAAMGHWLGAILPGVAWTRNVYRNAEEDLMPTTHRMFWAGGSMSLANDLRFGDNNYHPEERYKKSWYLINEQDNCVVLIEANRSYGQLGIQTIQFQPLTEDGGYFWTFATGRAIGPSGSITLGNWQD